MTISPTKTLTFQEYLDFCETSRDRYELVHGKLQLMTPPSWLHFLIADFLATAFKQEIVKRQQSWIALQGAGQQTTEDSARLPDVSVVPMELIVDRLKQTAVLTEAAILVVEVVSEITATQDYRDKVQEYQDKGIREYWIADPDPFGAAKYIGAPKRPTVSVYSLIDEVYQVQRFQDDDRVVSSVFPNLQLTANEILRAGQRS